MERRVEERGKKRDTELCQEAKKEGTKPCELCDPGTKLPKSQKS